MKLTPEQIKQITDELENNEGFVIFIQTKNKGVFSFINGNVETMVKHRLENDAEFLQQIAQATQDVFFNKLPNPFIDTTIN